MAYQYKDPTKFYNVSQEEIPAMPPPPEQAQPTPPAGPAPAAQPPMLTNVPRTARESLAAGQPTYFLSDRPETEELLAETGTQPFKYVMRDVRSQRPDETAVSFNDHWQKFKQEDLLPRMNLSYDPEITNPAVEGEKARQDFIRAIPIGTTGEALQVAYKEADKVFKQKELEIQHAQKMVNDLRTHAFQDYSERQKKEKPTQDQWLQQLNSPDLRVKEQAENHIISEIQAGSMPGERLDALSIYPNKKVSDAAKAVRTEVEKTKLRQQMGGEGLPSLGTAQAGQTNQDALTDLPPAVQAVVKQVVEYKIPLPSGFALRSPYWQTVLSRASLYDPGFDATQYNVRMRLRQDFTSGKSAQNIRSLNTAIGHLDSLDKSGKALENSSLQTWNWITNYGLQKMGDPRVDRFLTDATAVESELANVFKGMGASDQEIKSWRSRINETKSPAQIKGIIDEAIDLLGSRLGALQAQYETGMGKPKEFRFLSPKSREILKKLGSDIAKTDEIGGVMGTSAGPPKSSKEDWMARARLKNPGSSDKELSDFYDKKYGGQ